MSDNDPQFVNDPEQGRRVRSSHGRRRSKKKRERLVKQLQFLAIVGVIAIVLAFVAYRIFRPSATNTAAAITSVDFDPIEEYDVILDKGTVDQKLILLKALVEEPQRDKDLPILTDLNNKIVVVASEVLNNKQIVDKDREYAVLKKMDSIWRLYILSLRNEVHDPVLCDQFRKSVEEFINSENETIAREAHIGRLRYFTGETLCTRNTDISFVASAATEALSAYPHDKDVIDEVRRSHSQLISFSKEYATIVSEAVIASQANNESQDFKEMARFLNDLNLLYEFGIGNLPSISDIKSSVEEFYKRVNEIAQKPNVGETVYKQLLNAIMYLEKNQHNDLALELGNTISRMSSTQTEPKLAEMGKKIGDAAVKRNQLINSKWQFSETDSRGKAVENSQYDGAVTLIVMYPQSRFTAKFLKMMQSLERGFQGRNLRIIYVAVLTAEDDSGSVDQSVAKQNTLLISHLENPNNYLKQCPTDRLPYFILVNQEGNVSNINVPINALKTRIEALL